MSGSRRTRDRHGRGTRRGLVPPYAVVGGRRVRLPGWQHPAGRFHDLVVRELEQVVVPWREELGRLVLEVADVPSGEDDEDLVADETSAGVVPLARVVPGSPHLLVVYRRPLERRAVDDQDLRDLVHDVVVDAVARLLGRDPDEVDPDQG